VTAIQTATGSEVPQWLEELHVIDVDTHLVEPPDLWTSRAPAQYRDRVPHLVETPEGPQWFADGVFLARTRPGGGVVLADGTKTRGVEFFGLDVTELHAASWDPQARLELMDRTGIYAQVCYPQLSGFGNQNFVGVTDADLRWLCSSIYNEAMAEVQESTGGRVLPMATVPWWNVEQSVVEAERAASLGLRGIVMCSDPHHRGAPDLGDRAWDPFWAACSENQLSVNFHIGSTNDMKAWFGSFTWPSGSGDEKLAVGTVQSFMANGIVISNLVYAGVLERFPDLKVVSVESGIGWFPFLMEALDHQYAEARIQHSGDVSRGSRTLDLFGDQSSTAGLRISRPPSEYLRRQVYGCFWFETAGPQALIDYIGADNVLFETDFPHPTCLYPDVQQYIVQTLGDVEPEVRRKVLQDNAAALYRIPLPGDH
jgi:predicted TIM-barrel fold metal-dependent hydrolase